MPRFPVYLELLPQEAIEVIGRAHRDAAPAQRLLEKEGFNYNGAVDIFDAGPIVECDRSEIRSIQNTRTARIKSIASSVSDSSESPLCIVSNRNLSEYRLIMSRIENPTEDEITLSASDAKMLNVDIGSEIQMLQMRN